MRFLSSLTSPPSSPSLEKRSKHLSPRSILGLFSRGKTERSQFSESNSAQKCTGISPSTSQNTGESHAKRLGASPKAQRRRSKSNSAQKRKSSLPASPANSGFSPLTNQSGASPNAQANSETPLIATGQFLSTSAVVAAESESAKPLPLSPNSSARYAGENPAVQLLQAMRDLDGYAMPRRFSCASAISPIAAPSPSALSPTKHQAPSSSTILDSASVSAELVHTNQKGGRKRSAGDANTEPPKPPDLVCKSLSDLELLWGGGLGSVTAAHNGNSADETQEEVQEEDEESQTECPTISSGVCSPRALRDVEEDLEWWEKPSPRLNPEKLVPWLGAERTTARDSAEEKRREKAHEVDRAEVSAAREDTARKMLELHLDSGSFMEEEEGPNFIQRRHTEPPAAPASLLQRISEESLAKEGCAKEGSAAPTLTEPVRRKRTPEEKAARAAKRAERARQASLPPKNATLLAEVRELEKKLKSDHTNPHTDYPSDVDNDSFLAPLRRARTADPELETPSRSLSMIARKNSLSRWTPGHTLQPKHTNEVLVIGHCAGTNSTNKDSSLKLKPKPKAPALAEIPSWNPTRAGRERAGAESTPQRRLSSTADAAKEGSKIGERRSMSLQRWNPRSLGATHGRANQVTKARYLDEIRVIGGGF